MPTRIIRIVNKLGLHARATAKLVDTANQYAAEVTLITDKGLQANAKSIMGLMMLGAGYGSQIELSAEGDHAEEALEAIATLFAARFGEPE